ncbi:MAG TPA: hemerythrin domain-containing protein [Polyangiaceae bacterium]|nr:hemerythrin domain-containing protein [Polyangiaceae bacterium]
MDGETRRRFLLGVGASALLVGCAKTVGGAASPPASGEGEEDEDDVSPPEDLMREHGALNRILLIYEESGRRLDGGDAPPIEVVAGAAGIIRKFIEQYHEKLEEDFLFPRFEKANVLVDLVATLRRQHLAGRVLTEAILRLATAEALQRETERKELVATLAKFVRMYRPHEAREDTVLFPAFRHIVSPKELDALGERFEDEEHRLFGKAGFDGIVDQVGELEKRLGTYDLDAFTPTGP